MYHNGNKKGVYKGEVCGIISFVIKYYIFIIKKTYLPNMKSSLARRLLRTLSKH